MKKSDVLKRFGGVMRTAKYLGLLHPCICRWKEDLSIAQQDRVIASCWRHGDDPFPLLKDNQHPRYAYIRSLKEYSHANH